MNNEPLGPKPKDNYESGTVSEAYADWMERRAEKAEGLLKRTRIYITDGELIQREIEAYFKEVAP